MKIMSVCLGKSRACVERWGTKTHLAYLMAATLLEGPIVLRLTSGGCLVFCVLGEIITEEEKL